MVTDLTHRYCLIASCLRIKKQKKRRKRWEQNIDWVVQLYVVRLLQMKSQSMHVGDLPLGSSW